MKAALAMPVAVTWRDPGGPVGSVKGIAEQSLEPASTDHVPLASAQCSPYALSEY